MISMPNRQWLSGGNREHHFNDGWRRWWSHLSVTGPWECGYSFMFTLSNDNYMLPWGVCQSISLMISKHVSSSGLLPPGIKQIPWINFTFNQVLWHDVTSPRAGALTRTLANSVVCGNKSNPHLYHIILAVHQTVTSQPLTPPFQ